jgi:transposase
LKRLAEEGLLSGKNLGVDATTRAANAAWKSMVRRDDGHSYDDHVAELMKAEGMEEPRLEQRQRFDRKRKKSLSNRDWVNPQDPETRIPKRKDGRTHLAYKAEQVVDLDTGAVVALGIQLVSASSSETSGSCASICEDCTLGGFKISFRRLFEIASRVVRIFRRRASEI